ncbi:MAG: hypothetical protein JW748_13415 [Anaerolineales bacterium]|nr:hypothetical protein [Anaerolineales bacterium]
MIWLFKKFPAVMGALCLLLSMSFLYLALQQFQLSKDLPGAPERLTMAEIRRRLTDNPADIWAEVLDGHVDCNSLENWKATTNYFFVDKYTSLLIANFDGTIVLRGSVKEWPACEAILSRPLVGIVSRDTAPIATEVWEKNMNNIRQYPRAYVMSFCNGCTPFKKFEVVWIGIGLSAVFFIIFGAGMYMEVDRCKKRTAAV